ncbi:hypothetical protein NEOLEDRAFT_1127777 [Neolentinus lepideus HHB14362 ss-1]|uniref:Uncharacterized protein n=1 Tax=Neolentinus lepideus HHB14362 ss-1 TaxID=1314782 RepID=A0A165VMA2_9AGAM|nr:hypothetical protein NEOLEDRAFT_1127777 [Neolentinus lepideus HHB14362 ss-1]
MSKHVRKPSDGKAAVGASRLPSAIGKNGVQRPVLNELTTGALNVKVRRFESVMPPRRH